MTPSFPYELAVRTVIVATRRYDLLCLRDFEATVTDLADRVTRGADRRWFEDWCPMFGALWPSALHLADAVARDAVRDRTVLELGCGLALPSLVAAGAGARVVATDRHPDTAGFLRENMARNGVVVRYERFDWGGEVPADIGPTFDRVVASDVLYTAEMPEVLAAAFSRFLAPDGVGLLTDPGRPWLQEFAEAAGRRGLRVEVDVVGDADAVFLLTVRRR
jgi:predicted nicotinamide N-methyase